MTIITGMTPRGGEPGDAITLTGTALGVLEGTLTVDGVPAGVIISWSDIQVVFTVPFGTQLDGNYIVRLVREDLTDFDEEQFWIPASNPIVSDLDYQLPMSETGPTQNTDLPRRAEAAVFNRLLDRIGVTGAGGNTVVVEGFIVAGPTTTFTLATPPESVSKVFLVGNGISYYQVAGHLTVVGTLVTWQGIAFTSFDASDEVVVSYTV